MSALTETFQSDKFDLEKVSPETGGLDPQTMRPLSIPWTSAARLADCLVRPGSSLAGLRKIRQNLRGMLAAPRTISLGRRGSLSLDSAALIPCLQTANRWGLKTAYDLGEAYQQAGFRKLVGSELYVRALDLTTDAVRRFAMEHAESRLRVLHLPRVLQELFETEATVREVSYELMEVHAAVARRRPEVRWYEGRVVRVEEGEALVVVDQAGQKTLRAYDAEYMESQGLAARDPFILQELQWTPDTVVSSFLPALDIVDASTASLESESSAQPLSSLPKELIYGS